MDYISIIYFAVCLILILFIIGRLSPAGFPGSSRNIATDSNTNSVNTEQFDTYRNHSMAALLNQDSSLQEAEQFGFLQKAEQIAKYTWNERDPDGRMLYDKYYEQHLTDLNPTDTTYVERELLNPNDGYLDSKFEVVSDASGFASYELKGMADPDPTFTEFNGQLITLSQKNF